MCYFGGWKSAKDHVVKVCIRYPSTSVTWLPPTASVASAELCASANRIIPSIAVKLAFIDILLTVALIQQVVKGCKQ